MEIYPLDIVIHIINFLVLFLILRVILYKPVKKFLDERTARIQGELADAEKTSAEVAKTKAELDERLANAEVEAHEILVAGEEKASAQASKIISEAKDKSAALIAKAEEDGRKEKEQLVASVKDDITELSVELAGKLLKREVSAKDNKKVIDEFFSEMK